MYSAFIYILHSAPTFFRNIIHTVSGLWLTVFSSLASLVIPEQASLHNDDSGAGNSPLQSLSLQYKLLLQFYLMTWSSTIVTSYNESELDIQKLARICGFASVTDTLHV